MRTTARKQRSFTATRAVHGKLWRTVPSAPLRSTRNERLPRRDKDFSHLDTIRYFGKMDYIMNKDTALQHAARTAAEKIYRLSVPLYQSEQPMPINEIASII